MVNFFKYVVEVTLYTKITSQYIMFGITENTLVVI